MSLPFQVVFLPRNGFVRSLFAALTSICFLAIGHSYIRYIDNLAAEDDSRQLKVH